MNRPAPTTAVAIGRFIRFLFSPVQLRLIAIILAAPPLTLFAGWMVSLVAAPWPLDRAEQQLQILKGAIYIVLGIILVIVVALAMVKVKATGVGGVGLEVGGDDEHEGGR
ncbi:MAG: hypothetical protein J7521_20880 [Caulobacter sp.]|nr:hypothetical protein [Caulobacter sp.]